MLSFARDLRFAARSLRKSPGLTIVSAFALAVGIGLTTTMFSIIYGAIIRGLPFEEPDRIVAVYRTNPTFGPDNRQPVPIHDYLDYLASQRSFQQLAASYGGTVNVSGTERAERFRGSFVTANAFELSRVRPLLGRTIQPGEDRAGGERVAVLGYDMWKNRYGGDPSVLGKIIRANGLPYTVVGVMPAKYAFPDEAELWLPLQLDVATLKRGEGQWLDLAGRLRDGVSIEAANADLGAIAKRLATEFKETNDGLTAAAIPYTESQIPRQPRMMLYTMLGAVFFVLLIACANVANLLLDRAAHRTKEVGIRTALGASRSAVIRQFLAEAVLLASLGAAVGVGIAYFGIDLFNRAIADTQPPFWLDFRLHPAVLAFTISIALLSSIVSGFLPAYQSSRADINEILKDESRGASGFRVGKLSRALVVLEIALSCALLVAAGLMIKSVTKLRNVDPGFATKTVFTARMGFPSAYTDTARQRLFFDAVAERTAALPGVEGVSLSTGLPGANNGRGGFTIEGKSYTQDRDVPQTSSNTVSAGFFSTFQVPVLQGRVFAPSDRAGTLPVAIVNDAFARKYFGGNALGKRIRLGGLKSKADWLTIVGVVPTLFNADPERPRPEMVYTPLAQNHSNFLSLAVRTTSGNPMNITSRVRDVIASVDADIPLYFVYSMDEALARPTWFIRVFGTMFMIFGVIALFLAAVGLYAVMAFSVSRRSREVGIRMALGAQTGDVVQMILRQGLLQLGVGMAFGLAMAAGVSQLLSILLFDVTPRDPSIFGGVVATLAAAGLLACYVPARRATTVDPLVALRSD